MVRTCDDCGEDFETLSRLRLHDCPEEGGIVEEGFVPEPKPESLPNEVLNEDQFSQLVSDDRISRVEKMLDMPLPGDQEAISIVVEIDGRSYGLHCDHDTAEWYTVAEGDDFEQVKNQHMEWLSDDIGKVTGGAPDPSTLDELDVPNEITKHCDQCGGVHELSAQPDSFTSMMGMVEYEGFCEDAGTPIIVTRNIEDSLE